MFNLLEESFALLHKGLPPVKRGRKAQGSAVQQIKQILCKASLAFFGGALMHKGLPPVTIPGGGGRGREEGGSLCREKKVQTL